MVDRILDLDPAAHLTQREAPIYLGHTDEWLNRRGFALGDTPYGPPPETDPEEARPAEAGEDEVALHGVVLAVEDIPHGDGNNGTVTVDFGTSGRADTVSVPAPANTSRVDAERARLAAHQKAVEATWANGRPGGNVWGEL